MPLHIDNETHWRSSDIRRLVNACLNAAEADLSRKYKVVVIYNVRHRKLRYKKSTMALTAISTIDLAVSIWPLDTFITIKLPKGGPRNIHSNPMVAIASSAAAPREGKLLSPSETYRLANNLAFMLSREDPANILMMDLCDGRKSDMPPAWADAAKLLICKARRS